MLAATCTRVGIGQCFSWQLFPCWGNRRRFLRIPGFVAGPASLRVGALSSRFWVCITSTYPPPLPAPPCPAQFPWERHSAAHIPGKQETSKPRDQTRTGSAGRAHVPATEHTGPEKKEGKFYLNSLLPLERRGGEKEKHLGFFPPLLVIFKNLSPLKEERDSRSSDILILN